MIALTFYRCRIDWFRSLTHTSLNWKGALLGEAKYYVMALTFYRCRETRELIFECFTQIPAKCSQQFSRILVTFFWMFSKIFENSISSLFTQNYSQLCQNFNFPVGTLLKSLTYMLYFLHNNIPKIFHNFSQFIKKFFQQFLQNFLNIS